jgi:uncharacterized protein (DUF1501 family)
MLDAGFSVRAVCLDSSGWDTHSGQGQGQAGGAFARRAGDLAAGLVRLADSLRARGPWLVVVMTEFGRTVKPNGSAGSDHGHGSVMLVAGSSVRPGVHCDWPGLTSDRLYEGRDLAVTTDYRDVLAEVLRSHLGRNAPAETFPKHRARPVGVVG